MTEEQALYTKKKLKEIEETQKKFELDMIKLRTELLENALYFDSYSEMYMFIKNNTPSLEAFNIDMLEARELWFKRNKK